MRARLRPPSKAHPGIRCLAAAALAVVAVCVAVAAIEAQEPAARARLEDWADRSAFRAWFTALADAQFYRPTSDVTDCSSFVRHAVREALRPHTPDWWRRLGIPGLPSHADVRNAPPAGRSSWPIFRVSDDAYGEFADARTIVRYNARIVSRDTSAAVPGDLLYFHRPGEEGADHLMVYLGASAFDRSADDWVVYHTGPDGSNSGEARKVRLADLLRHPVPRWRPIGGNPGFIGVFRLSFL